jgi:sortase A
MTWLRQWAGRVIPLLLAAGLLAIGYAAYQLVAIRTYQHDQREQYRHIKDDSRLQPDAAPIVPAEGETIGEMTMPRLGLSAMVAQGESPAVLKHSVGHLTDTALPGQIGNVVLAGHRDTFFRPLRHVRVGDAITISTRRGDFQYIVESTSVVPPTDLSVLDPVGSHTLTLITCFPFVYVGSAPNRFIVRAREQTAVATP